MFDAVFADIASHLGRAAVRHDQGLAPRSQRDRRRRAARADGFDARELLASLPHRPGVYRMLDAAGRGAVRRQGARPARSASSSYFQKSGHEPRIAMMVAQIARVETTVMRTEGEALLLENNLIKAHQPRYNILFRDDKSYPYVCLTRRAVSRSCASIAARSTSKHDTSGRFPSAGAVREGIATLQKVFQLRTCENTVFANRSRPCMLHQIQRCTAPCVGLISEAEYARTCRARRCSCRARPTRCCAQLKTQMEAAAAALEFERAARVRDKITRLQQLQSRQFVESATAGDIDVVAAAHRAGLIAVNVVMIRGGRHVGDRTFFPQHAEARQRSTEVIRRSSRSTTSSGRCRRRSSCRTREDADALAEVLTAAVGAQGARSSTNPGGERRVWLTMATQNAPLAIAPEARAEGDAGGAAGRAAGSARPAVDRRSASSASTSATRWARPRSRRA